MRIKFLLTALVAVLFLSACSSFRETGVSEDGTLRQIMTEHTEEIEVPADPQRIVLFRAMDAGNAELLDGDVVGVSEWVKESKFSDAFMDDQVTYLEHGDLDALEALDPDLIVTYAPDEYFFEYQEIAPTVQVNYSTSAFSPFRERLYLTHLYNLGVIINQRDSAEALGDEWLADTTRLQREAAGIVSGQTAMVLRDVDGGYYLQDQYSSFGTEAVYDVLKFGMPESVSGALEENGSTVIRPRELGAFDPDYVFISTASGGADIKTEIAQAMDMPEGNVFLLDEDSYRLNDLSSVRAQTEEIIEMLK
ncbi:hypothetical protein [Salinicoccus albus]|uniref:hypothetical protein n=1 Tax=Salinicoccus albus TaxID=418756 RepID=UPI0003746051|nr:hypothetical protein [Salinicoccus albus]